MIVIEYCELGGKTDYRETKQTHFHQKSLKLGHFWVPHWVSRSVTLVLEFHFIGQILRQVSGGCIPRSYVLRIGQKWSSRGQDSHFIYMTGSNFLISRGETNFRQEPQSILPRLANKDQPNCFGKVYQSHRRRTLAQLQKGGTFNDNPSPTSKGAKNSTNQWTKYPWR